MYLTRNPATPSPQGPSTPVPEVRLQEAVRSTLAHSVLVATVLPQLYFIVVKTAVSIPDPVFQAAERLAKRLGIPRSRLYSRAIERYVSDAQQRDVTALLNQVYAEEQAELDSALAALQWASIPHEPW